MKRFTETEKWKDEWFCSLSILNKLVFLFLIDNCDNAGFFEINARLNSFLIGILESEYLGALNGLKKGLVKSKDEKKYFIKNFLFHQKNLPLNVLNNAHKQIIFLIENNKSLFDYDFEKLGAKEGLISPKGKCIGIGKKEIIENFISESLESQIWLEAICMKSKISQSLIPVMFENFKNHLISTAENHLTLKDFQHHFSSWIVKQEKPKDPSKPKMVY